MIIPDGVTRDGRQKINQSGDEYYGQPVQRSVMKYVDMSAEEAYVAFFGYFDAEDE